MRKRIDKQGVTNYYDAFMPEETLRYIFRILSFKLIVENPSFYGYMIQSRDYYPVLDPEFGEGIVRGEARLLQHPAGTGVIGVGLGVDPDDVQGGKRLPAHLPDGSGHDTLPPEGFRGPPPPSSWYCSK